MIIAVFFHTATVFKVSSLACLGGDNGGVCRLFPKELLLRG